MTATVLSVAAAQLIRRVIEKMEAVASDLTLDFPMHSRRRGSLENHGLWQCVETFVADRGRSGQVPSLWDGDAAGRIVEVIERKLN